MIGMRNISGLVLLAMLLLASIAMAQEIGAEDSSGVQCSFCGMIDCQMGCKAENVNAQGEKVMVMPGLPDWLYYGGVAIVLLVSFVVAELVGRSTGPSTRWRFNLLRFSPIKWFVTRPYFQFALQLPVAVVFAVLVYIGLYGHQIINIVPTITWTIWWAGLVCLVAVGGKIWCMICPWDLIATMLSRLRFWGTGPGPLNLGLKWPKFLRNIGMAIVLFIVLTWLELGYHITSSPQFTAYMAIGILLLTVVPALLFEKKSFCRHGCFVGRITGLYATFSPIEVRATDKDVCKTCTTRDCYNGNDKGNPCPTSLSLATLVDNTYCLKCCECAKSCPKDNVSVNLRPFAADLYEYSGPRLDEAILAIVLLSLTSFHGLTMTPLWENVSAPGGTVIGWITSTMHTARLTSFTIGMTGVLLGPILLYLLVCAITLAVAKRLHASGSLTSKAPGFWKIFIQFSYSLLPIALFYHIAHNGMHLFMEGQNLLTLISDPLGRGWDLFGTAGITYAPILGKDTIWIVQVILVIIGHVYGITVSQRTAQKLFGTGRTATLVQLPLLASMILFSFVSLWLMHLDMNMRGTLM